MYFVIVGTSTEHIRFWTISIHVGPMICSSVTPQAPPSTIPISSIGLPTPPKPTPFWCCWFSSSCWVGYSGWCGDKCIKLQWITSWRVKGSRKGWTRSVWGQGRKGIRGTSRRWLRDLSRKFPSKEAFPSLKLSICWSAASFCFLIRLFGICGGGGCGFGSIICWGEITSSRINNTSLKMRLKFPSPSGRYALYLI